MALDWFGNGFLEIIPKEKYRLIGVHQSLKFCIRGHSQISGKTTYRMGGNTYKSDKGLIFLIHKKLITKNSIKIWSKDLNRHSLKKI